MSEIPQSLIVLAGLPLTGKTTIGERLAVLIPAMLLDIDASRQEIAPGRQWRGPEEERTIMRAAYELNHQKARTLLEMGSTVILAAMYSRPEYHQMLHDLAAQQRIPLRLFLLYIPDEVVVTRMTERQVAGALSNINSFKSYQEIAERYEPFPAREAEIDTSPPLLDTVATLLKLLDSSRTAQ